MEANVHIEILEGSKVIQEIHGHNVFTQKGREWLQDIVRLSFIPKNRIGTGDSIEPITGSEVELADADNLFTPEMVGQDVTITLASNPTNNGLFPVTSFFPATGLLPNRIRYTNAGGILEPIFAGKWSFADVPITNNRLRWIAVGQGSQDENVGVESLVDPVIVAPVVYLVVLPTPTFLIQTAANYVSTFGPTTGLNGNAPFDVSEVGLVVDYADGSGPTVNPANPPTGLVVAYKTFTPMPINPALQSLRVTWELRF